MAGDPLVTTVDLDVQAAAREALAGVPGRVALVAVDAGTGGVLAVANSPVEELPTALAGAYPPESTFKIVTATAALRSGTGTAEAAGGAHAWTVGYQGDVAFAVLVENGGAGSEVAAPVAARFLTALGG